MANTHLLRGFKSIDDALWLRPAVQQNPFKSKLFELVPTSTVFIEPIGKALLVDRTGKIGFPQSSVG